jgi:U3 small nucleolar RNA-associated protein 20
MLCILLPRMIEKYGFPPAGDRDSCRLPQGWQDQIVSKFENLEISPFPERGPYNKDPQVWRDRCLPKYAALLRLLELASVHPSTNARIAELLLRKLKLALRPSSTLASDEVHFIVSQGFHAYLRMSKPGESVDSTLGPLLRAAVPRFAQSVGFLEAFLAYEEYLQGLEETGKHDTPSTDSSSSYDDPVITSLVENLGAPSHEIRLASLKLLKQMNNLQGSHEFVDMMIEVEQLPLSLEHTRTIAMLLRKLGQKYASLDESSWLQKGVPNFAFGMLTVKLSPVWDDATEALVQMAQTKAGEEIVSAIAFKWLDVPSPRWTPPSSDNLSRNRPVVTDFDCTLLQSLHRRAEDVHKMATTPDDLMLQRFDEGQCTSDALPGNARSRALKVFNAAPFIAERRSRRLVPHLLPWALEDDAVVQDDNDELDQTYWSLADRKALLGVFSQFINPKVLYLHEKVYEGLLQLMENGDVEVQKLTLKAILAWKQVGVKTYQENLEYLLDEARFKNELTVFLQGDSVIKSEHRAELMPVLLRLLYGRTISKKGAASGKRGLQSTRLAVLRNLSVQDMGGFLDIATGKLRNVKVVNTSTSREKLFDRPIIDPRKQVGFLNMVSALISELGTNVSPYMETILNAVLYCLVYSCRHLKGTSSEADNAADEDEENASAHSLLKIIRSTGIKCLTMLFQNAQDFQWDPYHGIIVEEVVAPRLENLASEMIQGVSSILQLLSIWSALPKAAMFLAPYGDALPQGVLPKVIECLAAAKAKDEVRVFILEIIRNLVKLALAPAQESEFNELIKAEIIEPNARPMLETITAILQAPTTTTNLLDSCVEALLSLAQVLREPESVDSVLRICSFLLQQPPRRVSPRTKGRLLLVVENFVALINPADHPDLCNDVYETLASLFSYFKDRENRQALCRAVAAISVTDPGKTAVAELCAELNSYKEGRIDERHYDRRLAAFNSVSQKREVPLTPQEWLPLLHNCLFFIKDDEEFGVLSTNSADVLRRFVQDTADAPSGPSKAKFDEYMSTILMPAIYAGARESSDTVRREILRVLGFILSTVPQWEPVKDMGGLLTEVQEDTTEPAFFFNILSPAVSRQMEALQALEKANQTQEMASQNLAQFFIPLLENFIFGKTEGVDDRGLSAQASSVIGSLAMSLHWKHYRTTLQRYIGYVGSKPEHQKHTIRLLGRFTDAIVAAAEHMPSAEAMEVDQQEASSSVPRRLSLTMPKQAQLSSEVVDYFLPMLVKHLHEKDESEVSYRVPVGVTIVKLLKILPSEQMDQRLAGVLTDICHILRSKATESRDLARDTLVQIATILGPSFFGFILRELRGALTKGYQLHVLSFTMHSILVAIIPGLTPGDLDYCLPSIVTVIMDDIFGVIGQEKDAEGYISQMKEVKSSKSQDSMELIAKNTSITHLIDLVKPLQALLMQKVDLKMIRKIDNLMGRISAGLLQNPAAESRDTLVFCYEVIQNVYKSREPQVEQKLDPRVRKYLVQKGAKKSGDRGKTSRNTFRLLRFAIDVLRSMFKKHDSLRTPENILGFLPIFGDAILEAEDDVKISTFRLLAVIVKVPFEGPEGTEIYKVAVREAMKSVAHSVSTTTELSQAALKMLSVVLRDRKDVPIKDSAVDMLLGKLKDDLTEPQYRHVTFNFLRSILERRVETALVYDTMDYVGTVMITNDDKDTRDLARGAFFQFIREYPQKKARWTKQLTFIVANLKYQREGGRLSVMEVVHLLLMKSSDEFVQEIAATCFLPLFFVMANDESEKCCLAASELLKEIFRRADKERTQKFLTLLRTWLDKDENPAVLKLALEVWAHYFESSDSAPKNQKDFKLVFAKVVGILSADDLHNVNGELVEAALGLTAVLVGVFPEKMLSSGSEEFWTHVGRCMGHPHAPVKLAAIKLISSYLSNFAQNIGRAPPGEPIEGSHGLHLDSTKIDDLVRLALNILNGREVDEALATEAGQILIFLGPRLPTPAATADGDEAEDAQEGEEEEESEDEQPRQKDLQYLFWRLSRILRKEIRPTAVAIAPKPVAMEVLETICRRSPAERLQPSLKTILTPLQNITDPSIRPPQSIDEVFQTKHEHIKTRAQILMDALQKKFGTAEYSKQLMAIREEVRARRQMRSSKRKIEAIAQPEKYGRDKRKKFEKNRERKKVRSSEQRSMRQAYKQW